MSLDDLVEKTDIQYTKLYDMLVIVTMSTAAKNTLIQNLE